MRFAAILFDFDGVLIESEWAGNEHAAQWLTAAGHPVTTRQALDHFTGLSGQDFVDAIESLIAAPLPAGFHEARSEIDDRMIAEGIAEVEGAVRFVRSLDPALPRAVVSSSRLRWIKAHLNHLGIADAFGPHLYSGREHVERGKPAPDLYLHAARQLDVPIEQCVIIEDSAVGATGAVASGATVIGFLGADHIGEGHAERLQDIGVHHLASTFDEVARLLA
ncbi:HAD family phosphatase [Sphingomonas sp. LY160]|uniref:HAD family hydrolase n=1 Tax=Sphingomonas sp. LY160 TaxID=3095342 RepID=UPI002ADEB9B3|nr:HAD family phosphatase [Sphingomonas sp. LY160]MEA1072425.1 HAD family phosphatase [Sphingomonas sp. LY160]